MTTAKWQNQIIRTDDNRRVMWVMNLGSAGLIYPDPPFNTNRRNNPPISSEAGGPVLLERPLKDS